MNDAPVLTDELVEAVFARRADRGEPDGVYTGIVDAVSGTPQRRGLRAVLRSRRDPGAGLRLLVVAVLAAAALTGLAVVGGRPTRPAPAPLTTRLIDDFVQPFQYREDPSIPVTIRYRTPAAIAFADIGDYVGYVSSAYPRTPDGQPLPSSWGIVLASRAGTSVDGCRATGQTGETVLRDAPADLMDDLRRIDGVALGASVPTSIDGWAGVAASLDPDANQCPNAGLTTRPSGLGRTNLHVMRFDVPSRLVVADVDRSTILVQTWAWTDADLERVMPLAAAFLDGIHFTTQSGPQATGPVETSMAEGVLPADRRTVPYFNRPFEYRDSAEHPVTPSYRGMNLLAFGWGIDEAAEYSAYRATPDGWGIVMFPARGAVVHGCATSGRVEVAEEPAAFLDDIHDIGGVGVTGVSEGTFDGRPSLVATVDPSEQRCGVPDLHPAGAGLGSGFVRFDTPSRLIVTEVEGMTIVLQVWAPTSEGLAAAMPDATAFLDGIHFTGQGTSP